MVCVCGQWRKGAGGECKWNLQTLKFSFRYQRKPCFHSLSNAQNVGTAES